MPDEQSGQPPPGNPEVQSPAQTAAIGAVEKRVMALEAESRTHQKLNETNSLSEAVKVGINAALLITTVVIACIYSHQLTAMRDSNDITRESVQSVQRAFVNFVSVSPSEGTPIVQNGKLEQTLRFAANFENDGNTPAQNVRSYFDVQQLPEPPDGIVFLGKPFPGSNYISPKGTLHPGPVDRDWPFIIGMEFPGWDRIGTGGFDFKTTDRKIFLWGWVTYNDVFPKTQRHLTEFCYRIQQIAFHPEHQSISAQSINCEKHNCTDETCPDYEYLSSLN